MPILPAVPGLMRARSNWTIDTQPWSVALHVLKSIPEPWLPTEMATILGIIDTFMTSDIIPLVGSTVTSVNVEGTDLSSNMGITDTMGGGGSGTATGTHPLPINVALRATFDPPLRYRGGRFGLNWAGLDQSDLKSGSATEWSAATIAAWTSAISNLYGVLHNADLGTGNTGDGVLVSYFTGHAMRVVPLVMQLWNSGQNIQERVCTRRRRLGKGIPG